MVQANGRLQSAYEHAVQLVLHQKLSLRNAVSETLAAKRVRITCATLGRRVQARRAGNAVTRQPGRPPALTIEQESEVAEMCRHFALRGSPVVFEEIADVVKDAFGNLPNVAARVTAGRPGRDWIKSFCKRHQLAVNVPSRQAAERYRSTNAEVLTAHILNLQDVYRELKIDPTRLFNLDETG
eukprot:IDg8415t1